MWDEMNEEALKEEDWRYKYRSAFTYAPYNDLDKMGYEGPKRYPAQVRSYDYSVLFIRYYRFISKQSWDLRRSC